MIHPIPFRHLAKVTLGIIFTLAIALGADRAQAATVTIDGTIYTIGTETGTFNDLSSTLDDQPWYDDDTGNTALNAALDLGDALGYPNASGGQGPYFAFSASGGTTTVRFFTGIVTSSATPDLDTVFTYAVVMDTTAIPVPAALPLLLGGLGALTVLRRSRRRLG